MITAIALALVTRNVPDTRQTAAGTLDLAGAGLMTGAMVALMLMLTEAPAWGWRPAGVLGLFAAAAAVGALLIVVERKVADPLLDLRQIRRLPMATAHASAFFFDLVSYVFYVGLPAIIEAPHITGYGFGAALAALITAGAATLTGLDRARTVYPARSARQYQGSAPGITDLPEDP